jgi:hypothetical protein
MTVTDTFSRASAHGSLWIAKCSDREGQVFAEGECDAETPSGGEGLVTVPIVFTAIITHSIAKPVCNTIEAGPSHPLPWSIGCDLEYERSGAG